MGLLAADNVAAILGQIQTAQANGTETISNVMGHLESVTSSLTTQAALFAESVGSVSIDIRPPEAPALEPPPAPIQFTPTPLNITDLPPLDFGETPSLPSIPLAPQKDVGQQPEAPSAFSETVPANIPTFEQFTSVPRPTLLIPTLPTLESPVFTPFAGVRPIYEKTGEDIDIPPQDIKKYEDTDPKSLISRIELLKGQLEIEHADAQSMGFNTDLWDNIYAEHSGKSLNAYVKAQADALRMDAALGFHTPTGTAQAKLVKMRAEQLAAQNDFARTKTIERINREVAYKDKIFDVLIKDIPQLLYQADKDTKDRLLAAQDHANTVLMQVYDIYVKGFMASMETRKEGIEVYRNQLQAYEQEIRNHSALIEAEKVKKEYNASLLEKYSAEVSVNKIVVEAYKTEIEQNIALSRIEELKLKTFELQIAGFDAKSKAYSAYMMGKTAEANWYSDRVKAYQSDVQGYVAQVEAIAKQYGAASDLFRLKVSQNQAQIDAYKARADASGIKARAEAEFATANNHANSTYSQAIASFNEVNAKVWEAATQAHISAQTASMQMSKINLDAVQAAKTIASEAQSTVAKVYAQLISSALSQQHYSTTASGNASMSAGYSEHLDLGTLGQTK